MQKNLVVLNQIASIVWQKITQVIKTHNLHSLTHAFIARVNTQAWTKVKLIS